jgi:hypothetical protein
MIPRRLRNLLYRWIDRRQRIPWLWFKLSKTAHFCPEMDDLLILDNPEDCFCGYVKQPLALCTTCGHAKERRMMTPENECLDCIPGPDLFDHDPAEDWKNA